MFYYQNQFKNNLDHLDELKKRKEKETLAELKCSSKQEQNYKTFSIR